MFERLGNKVNIFKLNKQNLLHLFWQFCNNFHGAIPSIIYLYNVSKSSDFWEKWELKQMPIGKWNREQIKFDHKTSKYRIWLEIAKWTSTCNITKKFIKSILVTFPDFVTFSSCCDIMYILSQWMECKRITVM